MRARDVMDEAASGSGCLGQCDDDEPVFVLVGRDSLAAKVVKYWANLLETEAAGLRELTPKRQAKIRDARYVAAAMQDWPGRRLPG